MTIDWRHVRDELLTLCAGVGDDSILTTSQRASLGWIADRLPLGGAVLADEVGLGKTRIACAVAVAVVRAGGRVAIVGPRRIAYQWKTQMERIPLAESGELCIIGSMPELFDDIARVPQDETSSPDALAESILTNGPGRMVYVPDSFSMSAMPKAHKAGPWYVALPSMLAMALAEGGREERLAKNTRLGKLQAALEDDGAGSVRCITGGRRHLRGLAAMVRGLRRRKAILPRWKARLTADFRPLATGPLEPAWTKVYADDVRGHAFAQEIVAAWFGRFDLVIVDEAHRAATLLQQGDDSTSPTRLQWVLDELVALKDGGRRLCLTATPMSLGTRDWCALLQRATGECPPITAALDGFAAAVRAVGRSVSETGVVEDFERAAAAYIDALAPYVTRRRRTDEGLHVRLSSIPALAGRSYRHVHPVDVDLATAEGVWRRVFIAAEGLSAVLRGTDGLVEELSPFLGEADQESFASLVERCRSLHREVAVGWVRDETSALGAEVESVATRLGRTDAPAPAKAFVVRAAWWAKELASALTTAEQGRHPHPRLLTAVRTIEAHTLGPDPFDGEPGKVLVFGFNTRPLRELVKLLNARDVLRRLADGRLVSATLGDQPSESAAPGTVGKHAPIDRIDLEDLETARITMTDATIQARLGDLPPLGEVLATKAREYDNARERTIRRVESRLAVRRGEGWAGGNRTLMALVSGQEAKRVARTIASEIMDRAIGRRWTVEDLDAMLAGRERDGTVQGNELLDPEVDSALAVMVDEIERAQATDATLTVREWLENHTSVEAQRRTAYARLLDGRTPPGSLPNIQARFNRREGALQVLVANCQVGQVGLDLHEACRVVFQLQLVWNPGDVEQQIGRVDRMGSRWQRCVETWLDKPDEFVTVGAPKIVVHQLVTRGAYDQYQYDVLRDRRDVFEGGLFDLVLHESVDKNIVERLRKAVPDFSPIPGSARRGIENGPSRATYGRSESSTPAASSRTRSISDEEGPQ